MADTSGDHVPDGVSVDYWNQLEQWRSNFIANSSYQVNLSYDQMVALAKNATFLSEKDFAGYVFQNQMSDAQRQEVPWVAFATNHDNFYATLNSFSSVYQNLLGSGLDPAYGGQAWDLISQAFNQNLTSSEFEQQILHDENFAKAYPWLRYGLNYQRFTEFKGAQHKAFGRDLTNQEAVAVYAGSQASSGPDRSVSFQAPKQQTQAPGPPAQLSTAEVR